ncbi:hypothetical protein [Burkholderia thailandensis]|uniref:hypothetical protein n=1 Tax=Burkholderia thailandensis TaxID=57975 RepID=UPI0012D2F18B|nr:hypothetical protein [Burkholderia thailandensis]MCS6478849.1 hypothetical protein [Burkholderia thailandensis]
MRVVSGALLRTLPSNIQTSVVAASPRPAGRRAGTPERLAAVTAANGVSRHRARASRGAHARWANAVLARDAAAARMPARGAFGSGERRARTRAGRVRDVLGAAIAVRDFPVPAAQERATAAAVAKRIESETRPLGGLLSAGRGRAKRVPDARKSRLFAAATRDAARTSRPRSRLPACPHAAAITRVVRAARPCRPLRAVRIRFSASAARCRAMAFPMVIRR